LLRLNSGAAGRDWPYQRSSRAPSLQGITDRFHQIAHIVELLDFRATHIDGGSRLDGNDRIRLAERIPAGFGTTMATPRSWEYCDGDLIIFPK
jgi:hypothetical protein